jgi:peptide/nickel transport system permease protein
MTGIVIRVLLRRLVVSLLTLWAITLLVFLGTQLLPGDAAQAILGRDATQEALEALRQELGLKAPLYIQYTDWLGNMLSGHLGVSLSSGQPIWTVVGFRFWNTLFLASYAAIVAIPLSLSLGIVSAAYPNSTTDNAIRTISSILIAVPDFVVALLLVLLFAVTLGAFPAVVYNPTWSHPITMLSKTFLPMLTLVCAVMAYVVRSTRAAVLDMMKTPFVEMALLKGASKPRIVLRHALPNALGPIVNVVALTLSYLISGVVVVEVVFSYPGLGRLLIDAVVYRDLPLIQVTTLIFCTAYIITNFFSDLAMTFADPRGRYAQ